jgi:hypothetical protein
MLPTKYEYRVVPAPRTGTSKKGLRKTEEKFAYSLETLINDCAEDGWEFLRAETLPCEERVGISSKVERFQNLLVFRRAVAQAQPAARPEMVLSTPVPAAVASEPAETAAPPAGRKEPPLTQPPMEEPHAPEKPVLGLMQVIKGTRNATSPK